jgi:hypothetical protein
VVHQIVASIIVLICRSFLLREETKREWEMRPVKGVDVNIEGVVEEDLFTPPSSLLLLLFLCSLSTTFGERNRERNEGAMFTR